MRSIVLVSVLMLAAICVFMAAPARVNALPPNPCVMANIHPNPNSLPNGQVGQPYCPSNPVNIWVTPNNVCIPVIWTVSAGTLPNGLSLVSSAPNQADLCGTPTGPVGSSTFTVTAQATFLCGTVCFLSQTYTVVVF